MISDLLHNGERIDVILEALANPLRRSLLERLAERDIHVGELAKAAAVTMPAISRHLRILERADLIVRLKHGRNHMISLRRDPLQEAFRWIETLGSDSIGAAYHPVASSQPKLRTETSPADEVQAPAAPDSLDLSPDSLSALVKQLKRV